MSNDNQNNGGNAQDNNVYNNAGQQGSNAAPAPHSFGPPQNNPAYSNAVQRAMDTVTDDEEEDDGVLDIDDIMYPIGAILKIPINAMPGSKKTGRGFAKFEMMDPKTMRRFRNIYTGGIGSKRVQPLEANNFLIDEKFRGFENIRVRWQERYTSEAEWLKNDPRGQGLAESLIGEYFNATTPDTTDLRKS